MGDKIEESTENKNNRNNTTSNIPTGIKMLKSESVDMEDSLRLASDLRKPKLFRRSITVPTDILSTSANESKLMEMVTHTLLSQCLFCLFSSSSGIFFMFLGSGLGKPQARSGHGVVCNLKKRLVLYSMVKAMFLSFPLVGLCLMLPPSVDFCSAFLD